MNDALLWIVATLAVFMVAEAVSRRLSGAAFANPVMLSVAGLSVVLIVTGTPYDSYMRGGVFFHVLLGPATVALALPLWDHRREIARAALPIGAALVAGSVVAMGSAVAIGYGFGLQQDLLISLLPKSATAPVAIGISEQIGGIPALTAVLVILTGITGAVLAIPMLNLLGLRDRRAQGLATGIAAHGIGTAEALRVNPTAGAFAGIGMGLNAFLTAVLAPIALQLL